MVEEAIEVIGALWDGGNVVHRGDWFNVENAELFTRPGVAPPILMAVGGWRSAEVAARLCDGLIGVSPDPKIIEAFESSGGTGKPRLGQVHVCWAKNEAQARGTAHHWWPQAGLPPALLAELARPKNFAAAAETVDEDDVADAVVCGPDVDRHLAAIAEFLGAGYTEVYVHQIGPDQQGFLEFYRTEVLPRFG